MSCADLQRKTEPFSIQTTQHWLECRPPPLPLPVTVWAPFLGILDGCGSGTGYRAQVARGKSTLPSTFSLQALTQLQGPVAICKFTFNYRPVRLSYLSLSVSLNGHIQTNKRNLLMDSSRRRNTCALVGLQMLLGSEIS